MPLLSLYVVKEDKDGLAGIIAAVVVNGDIGFSGRAKK